MSKVYNQEQLKELFIKIFIKENPDKEEENYNFITWKFISEYQFLPEYFIEKAKDYVNWNLIVARQKLSESFIRKYKNYIVWKLLAKYQKLSEDFIREFQNSLHWGLISIYQKLSEEFIEEFQDKLDWFFLWKYQYNSEKFILKNFIKFDQLIINTILIEQKLSEDFLRNPKIINNKKNWKYISKYQILSEDFIREFQDYVDWESISSNQTLSEDFIREFQDQLCQTNKVNSCNIFKTQKLSEEFIEESIKKINVSKNENIWKNKMSENTIRKNIDIFEDNKINWYYISQYQTLSEDFIREFQDKVDWTSICEHQTLSEDFIREFQDKVWWLLILKYQSLSEDFLKEIYEKLSSDYQEDFWPIISQYQKLSEDFMREYQLELDWDLISKYQKMSESFVMEFYKYLNLHSIDITSFSEGFMNQFTFDPHFGRYILRTKQSIKKKGN